MRTRTFVALIAVVSPLAVPAVGSSASPGATQRVIVVLADGAGDAGTVARAHGRRPGVLVRAVYESALHGYVADMSPAALDAVAGDPRVAFVERDQPVKALAAVPTGVDRIQGDANPTAGIDGSDERVDVDIAVLDTGVVDHPDLNLAGTVRCTSVLLGLFASCRSASGDRNGHGTHVAGIAAAIDDGTGVVGVAPGARVWSVQVLDDLGNGLISDVLLGIDWVTARAGVLEVVNMSFSCDCTSQALDRAITRSTDAGVVYVAAAGNSSRDASTFSPARHPSVIAVSAMADFNGAPGGGAPSTCRDDVDDTFADFSNFGPLVDLAAPGVCITSTWRDGGYLAISGTSMASPHVAGAAALYLARNGLAASPTRWSTVLDGLRRSWAVAQTSPCGFGEGRSNEPMLLLAPCPAR